MAQSASSSWPVLTAGETLNYNLKWPSGISFGEATLRATHTGTEMFLEARVDADLPQYHVLYTFSSVANEQLCSQRFRQTLREGKRSVDDSFEFDQKNHQVRRTRNGRSTTASISDCARDPLALLYYFRQQLALGSLPVGTPEASGTFYLGQDYSVHYDSVKPEAGDAGSKEPQGDHFLIRVDGAPEAPDLEVWIRPDLRRDPVLLKVPFSLGELSAELQ
jgi:Protein of unknown function (DUF3108)